MSVSALTPIFTATVTEAGSLKLDSPLTFQRHVAKFKNKRVEVLVRRVRTQRSNEANRYYWGVVIALLAEEFGYEKQEMHEVLAMKFLRIEDCPITGSPRRRRTPDCDTSKFAEYVEDCIRLGADHGVVIPSSNEVEVSA